MVSYSVAVRRFSVRPSVRPAVSRRAAVHSWLKFGRNRRITPLNGGRKVEFLIVECYERKNTNCPYLGRWVKQVFLGQLASGKRLQCGPVLRYKDALKVNLKQCGIDPSVLGDDTQDRSAWRTLCHEAVTQYEDSLFEALAHKRAVRKGAQPRSNLSAWPL